MNASARAILAHFLLSLSITAAGLHLLVRITSEQPADALPPVLPLDLMDPETANVIRTADQAARIDPTNAENWGRLGMILLTHDLPSAAEAPLARAQRLAPDEARWPYFLGLLHSTQRPGEAIEEFQRSAFLCHDNPDAPRLRLIDLLIEQGRNDEASNQLQAILKVHPRHPRASLLLARIVLSSGDVGRAASLALEATDDPHTRRAAQTLLAQIRDRASDARLAAVHAAQAAALPADSPWPDPFWAEASATIASAPAELELADQQINSGDYDAAIDRCTAITRQQPSSGAAWLLLGRALLMKGDLAAAEKPLERAVECVPSSVQAHFHLGYLYRSKGEYKRALPHFERAAALSPDYAAAHYNVGLCRRALGENDAALSALKEAIRCDPADVRSHLAIAELFSALDDKENAESSARLALKLDSGNAAATNLLQRLHPSATTQHVP